VGQPDMTGNSINQGGTTAANTLNQPFGVYSTGVKLYIADSFNHRVLIFYTIPTSNNASADIVLGQANMTGNSANQGGSVAANTLNQPMYIYESANKLFVADGNNNRILIFIPTN
jgi:hypothetical protein